MKVKVDYDYFFNDEERAIAKRTLESALDYVPCPPWLRQLNIQKYKQPNHGELELSQTKKGMS